MYYWNQIKLMQSAGVSYYDFGTHRLNGKKLYDWYKTDSLTDRQIDILLKGGATLRGVTSEYAPELKKVLVCFDKEAQ